MKKENHGNCQKLIDQSVACFDCKKMKRCEEYQTFVEGATLMQINARGDE